MSGWQKRIAFVFLAAGALALSGCSANSQDTPRLYKSAYQNFGSICVVPAEDHSDSLDLILIQSLRDRGFKPVLIEPDDYDALAECRTRVVFSVGEGKSPESMSLTFTDKYTGENYHVKGGDTTPKATDIRVGSPLKEPEWVLMRLVERLFPDSPVTAR